jgi:beta-glucosidase
VQEPYRQKDLPIETRVNDLLSRMTLEEKIAQTDMIRGVELATKVHPKHFCAVDESSDFYWDRVELAIGPDGMGFVHDVYSVTKILNRLIYRLI